MVIIRVSPAVTLPHRAVIRQGGMGKAGSSAPWKFHGKPGPGSVLTIGLNSLSALPPTCADSRLAGRNFTRRRERFRKEGGDPQFILFRISECHNGAESLLMSSSLGFHARTLEIYALGKQRRARLAPLAFTTGRGASSGEDYSGDHRPHAVNTQRRV